MREKSAAVMPKALRKLVYDPQVALASTTEASTLVFVWNRDPAAASSTLSFPALRGEEVTVETVFPTALPAWPSTWDAASGTLSLDLTEAGEAARVLRLTRA